MSPRINNDKSSPATQESAAQRAELRQRLFPEGDRKVNSFYE
jgi:hypothetical protein